MPLFDTHAHLDDDRFSSDLETIIEDLPKKQRIGFFASLPEFNQAGVVWK